MNLLEAKRGKVVFTTAEDPDKPGYRFSPTSSGQAVQAAAQSGAEGSNLVDAVPWQG